MAEPHESRVYSDLAHLYDAFFGRVFVDREHEVIAELPFRAGQQVLEVGVGTGISLDAYPSYVRLELKEYRGGFKLVPLPTALSHTDCTICYNRNMKTSSQGVWSARSSPRWPFHHPIAS